MVQWSKESLESAIRHKDWLADGSRALNHGFQFALKDKVKVDLYESGKTVVGGPHSSFRLEVQNFINAGPQARIGENPAHANGETGFSAEVGLPSPAAADAAAPDGPALHIDIQIHIDASASPEQIEQIFASMARHLYRRES